MIANNRLIDIGQSSTLRNGVVSWHEFNNTSGSTPNEVAASKVFTNTGATYNITQVPGNAVGYRANSAEALCDVAYTELFNGISTELTIACWAVFNNIGTNDNRVFVSFGLDPENAAIDERSFEFGLNATGQPRITAHYGKSTTPALHHYYATTPALISGQLYCIIAYIDVAAPSTRMLVDNTVQTTTYTVQGTPLNVLNNTVVKPTIGRLIQVPSNAGDIQLDADISQLVLWDRKLTVEEEAAYYNNGAGIEYINL